MLVDELGERLDDLADHLVELVGHVGEQTADADERRVHAHAAHQLVDVEELLAIAPRVHEGRGGAEVEGAGAVPEQMAGEPAELAHDHAQVLPAQRHLDAEQPLDREREPEVVEQRRQVVHPVRVRDALLIGVALEVLLESGVQVADVGTAFAHDLAVEVEHQAEHPVRRGVHRPHVQFHGAVADLDEVDGVEAGLDAEPLATGFVLLAERIERRRPDLPSGGSAVIAILPACRAAAPARGAPTRGCA